MYMRDPFLHSLESDVQAVGCSDYSCMRVNRLTRKYPLITGGLHDAKPAGNYP